MVFRKTEIEVGMKWEQRNNKDGSLDELMGDCRIHLEQMRNNAWWMGIEAADGRYYHLWLTSKKEINARIQDEGEIKK